MITINFGLNLKVCGLKTATILIQDRWQQPRETSVKEENTVTNNRMNRKTKQFLTLILLTFSLFVNAQVYPVQVTPQFLPPNNVTLSSYTTTTTNKINLTLRLTDISENNLQVRLKMRIRGRGLHIQNRDFVIGALPISLNGGESKTLTSFDLRPYFELQNLVGISPQQYSRALPDGIYTVCFDVYTLNTPIPQLISNPQASCRVIQLIVNDPPILNTPQRGDQIVLKNQLNIFFGWESRSFSASNVSYEFEIRELWDDQIDPQAGFLSSPPLYKETTRANAFSYNNFKPALLPDKTYAWRVRAISTSGIDENAVYKNNGYSEIFHFRLTKDCDVPKFPLSEAISKSTVKINWQGNLEHNKYHVQYRKVSYTQETDKQRAKRDKKNKKRTKKGQKEKEYTSKKENHEWFEVYTQNEQAQISNLEAGQTYEFRVGGTCSSLASLKQYYSYTSENKFTMPTEEETVSYNCGVVPDIQITNQTPLQNIGVNESFTAGDFTVTVKEVQASGGRFSGKGFIVVPYLADTKIAVAFEGVTINTEYQLIDGVVKTTYDPTWGNVESIDEFVDGLGDLIDAIYDTLEDTLEGLGILDGDYNEENIDFEIEDIVVNENGETVIIGVNGDEQNLGAGNNTVITDENGNVIVVNEDGDTAAVNEDEENEADEESADTPYYVEIEGKAQQYKYNEKMYFVRQKTATTLFLKTTVDSLKFSKPIWKIGNEVIAEGDTISIDLKVLKSKSINITDSEDSEKKFKIKLRIYEKPITRFDLTVSNRNSFDGTFLFDDTNTGNNTSKKVLEDSGDYEEITNNLFHKDYSLDKKEKYFVPLVGTKLNQTVQIKVKLSSLNNSDPNFRVTLKPTSKYIKIGGKSTFDVISNNTIADIQVKESNLDENLKHYIEAYDQSNELVGKIEVICKAFTPKRIRFVYIEDENGLQSVLSENDILSKLNNSSHNQLFKEWSQESSVSIALDSLAKYSLQFKNIPTPNTQQILTERNRIRLSHLHIRNAYAYHIGLSDNDMENRDYTIIFLSSEFNGSTTASGGVSQVNGSNANKYHTTIMYSTADMQTVAHEQGHDVGLPHIFCYDVSRERNLNNCKNIIWNGSVDRKMTKHSALNNFMDYNSGTDNRNMFFKYQMENSK